MPRSIAAPAVPQRSRSHEQKWQTAFDQTHALFAPARRDVERMLPRTTSSVTYYGVLARLDALAADVSAAFADAVVK